MKVEIVTAEDLVKNLQACARGIYGIVYPDGKTHDKPFVVDLAKEIRTMAAFNTPGVIWLAPRLDVDEYPMPGTDDIVSGPQIEPSKENADEPDPPVDPAPAAVTAVPDLEEVQEESPAEETRDPENEKPDAKTKNRGGAPKDLGKWAEYQGRALSTREQNEIISGMKAEGYSDARISLVVRLSQTAVSYRLRKMRASGGEEQ